MVQTSQGLDTKQRGSTSICNANGCFTNQRGGCPTCSACGPRVKESTLKSSSTTVIKTRTKCPEVKGRGWLQALEIMWHHLYLAYVVELHSWFTNTFCSIIYYYIGKNTIGTEYVLQGSPIHNSDREEVTEGFRVFPTLTKPFLPAFLEIQVWIALESLCKSQD